MPIRELFGVKNANEFYCGTRDMVEEGAGPDADIIPFDQTDHPLDEVANAYGYEGRKVTLFNGEDYILLGECRGKINHNDILEIYISREKSGDAWEYYYAYYNGNSSPVPSLGNCNSFLGAVDTAILHYSSDPNWSPVNIEDIHFNITFPELLEIVESDPTYGWDVEDGESLYRDGTEITADDILWIQLHGRTINLSCEDGEYILKPRDRIPLEKIKEVSGFCESNDFAMEWDDDGRLIIYTNIQSVDENSFCYMEEEE